MANHIISVHRKKYAAGLFWQPVVNGSGGRIGARRLARSIDGHYSFYVEYNQMIGLAQSRSGYRSGMPSAAAEIVEAMVEHSSFLAAFTTNVGFYIVAVRNGIILQDKIYDSESVARKEYSSLAEMPDWGAFIAPSPWGMPRAVERGIEDVITGHSHTALRSISISVSVGFSVLALAVFVFLIGAVFRTSILQTISPRPKISNIDSELAAEYKRQVEEKNKQLDAQYKIEKKLPPEPIVMPYELLPDIYQRAEICYRAIAFLMQPIPGWNQVSVKCDEGHATAQLRRSFGTLGDFYSIATDLMPGAFVQELSDDLVSVRVALPKLKPYASQDERDADTIVRDITTIFQGMDTNADIHVVTDTVTNGVDTAYFDIVEIAASSKIVPMQFMQMFQNFGGVYLTACDWNSSSRTWNYEVIIYAK